MGLYYRIWVDCILRARQNPANRDSWIEVSMLIMTLAMAFNFILLMTILETHVFKRTVYDLEVSFLPGPINSLLDFILLYFLPCLTINYLLIYRNKRYLKLIERYPFYNGKLVIPYFLISFMLPVVLLLVGIIFFR